MSVVVDAATGRIMAWSDAIPLRYEYTGGVAGEAFLRGLRDGMILASKCQRCGETRVPPRTYCLQCYGRTRLDIELLHHGRISALSRARLTAEGEKPPSTVWTTIGFVTYEGVEGGLVHKIIREEEVTPRVGDPVRPHFAPRDTRRGSIADLLGFAVTERRGVRND